jgi:rod shape-determining protein MreD
MIADIAKAAAVLFVAAILQVTLLSQIDVFHGAPDLVLVTLVAVALLRGTIFGAAAGFGAGLVVDTATLQTLGVTSGATARPQAATARTHRSSPLRS